MSVMTGRGDELPVPFGLVLATRRRRATASAIDGAIIAAPWVAWAAWSRSTDGKLELSDLARDLDARLSSWWFRVSVVTTSALWIALARSPGDRLMRIRKVSVRTGRRPRLAQTILVVAIETGVRAGMGAALSLGFERRRRAGTDVRLREIRSETRSLRARYRADRDGYNQAVMELYRNAGLTPFSDIPVGVAIGEIVVLTMLSSYMPWSTLRQPVADRLAGIIVVRS
jgi:hypothetical protein